MKNTRNARNTKKMNTKMAAFLGAAASTVLTLTAVTVVTVASRINSDPPAKAGISAVTTQVQTPAPEKKEVVTTPQVQTHAAEKKEAITAAQVQTPASVKKEAVTAAQAQTPSPVKKEAVTAAQVQTPVPEKKEIVTAAQVQTPAPEKTETVPAAQKYDTLSEQLEAAKNAGLFVPEGEVNDWTIHSAKDGFPVGTYFCGDKTLYVQKVNNANYNITVKVPTGDNTAALYDIHACANGSKMYYTNAVKLAVTYDADGRQTDTKVIDNDHSGTFDASDAGYTWIDTEGTTIFVPWIGFPYRVNK